MVQARDPCALLRHAAGSGDIDLLTLIERRLVGSGPRGRPRGSVVEAYIILVRELRLVPTGADELTDGR